MATTRVTPARLGHPVLVHREGAAASVLEPCEHGTETCVHRRGLGDRGLPEFDNRGSVDRAAAAIPSRRLSRDDSQ